MLPAWMIACALLVLGCNSVFWNQRNSILSEFPYLMFSFGALLVIQRAYEHLSAENWRLGVGLLPSALLYCAYGTRTIGIALVPAVVLADLFKFKRPSQFVIAVIAITGVFVLVQGLLITSPKSYVNAFRFSWGTLFTNALFYAKALSYVWQNGFSKAAQIAFALFFTALAAMGFVRNLWKEKSVREFYLLTYLVLFAWSAQVGLRGLLPILPLYFVYGLQEFERMVESVGANRAAAMVALLVVVGTMYCGEFREETRQTPALNVRDTTAQELFAFLKVHTQPSDILVCSKPRSLALFVNRDVAGLDFGEPPEDSASFMKSIHAVWFIKTRWDPPALEHLLQGANGRAVEVFPNSDYQVFHLDWTGEETGEDPHLSERIDTGLSVRMWEHITLCSTRCTEADV
jgi:hypothetical protein